jgi:RNA polymerase sigma-70 factor (ECF subfamily)
MEPGVEPDPRELLAQARAGMNGSLGQLLQRYRSYVTLLARLQIRQQLQAKVDASDLVQETFCEASRDLAQFRGHSERELMHWLRRILAHRVAKLVRRYYGTQSRDVRLERQLQDDLDRSSQALAQGLAAPLTTPSQRILRRENAVLLADALERLPEHYRDVLIWRHVEGLTFADVAERMDRTVDSVKHLWSRALEQLRHQLLETR